MKKYIIALFGLWFLSMSAMAQTTLSMQAANLPQNMYLNPALAPHTSYMSIPLIPIIGGATISARSAFSYNDMITTQNGVKYLDYSKILKAGSSKGDVNSLNLNLDLVNFGIRISPNDFVGFNISTRLHVASSFPEGALGMFLDNSLDNLNQNYNVSMTPNMIGWTEAGVSYARTINDNFRIGARLKYLMGMASVQSSGVDFNLRKSASGYTIQGDMLVQGGNVDFGDYGKMINNMFSNHGVGADLGLEFTSNDKKWTAMASVSDFGAIFWNSNSSSQIRAKNPNQEFNFDGFGELQGLFDGTIDFPHLMDSVLTSFTQTIGVDTLRGESFSTMLPVRYHALVEYSIDPEFRHNVSLSFLGSQVYKGGFDYAISVGYTYRPVSDRWQIMANYTYRPRIPYSISIGGAYTSNKIQLYLGLENVLSMIDAKNSRNIGVQFAFNVKL